MVTHAWASLAAFTAGAVFSPSRLTHLPPASSYPRLGPPRVSIGAAVVSHYLALAAPPAEFSVGPRPQAGRTRRVGIAPRRVGVGHGEGGAER